MKSPFYRKATNKITSIEITVRREDGNDTHVAFFEEDKIKDLIESEPFFKDIADYKDEN